MCEKVSTIFRAELRKSPHSTAIRTQRRRNPHPALPAGGRKQASGRPVGLSISQSGGRSGGRRWRERFASIGPVGRGSRAAQHRLH